MVRLWRVAVAWCHAANSVCRRSHPHLKLKNPKEQATKALKSLARDASTKQQIVNAAMVLGVAVTFL